MVFAGIFARIPNDHMWFHSIQTQMFNEVDEIQ